MPSVAKMAEKIVNGTPVEDIAAGFKPLGRVRERDFRALWSDPALSMAEIGRRLGISGPAVRDRARARGLLPRTRSKARLRLTEAQQALFTLLYPRGPLYRHRVPRARQDGDQKRLGPVRHQIPQAPGASRERPGVAHRGPHTRPLA